MWFGFVKINIRVQILKSEKLILRIFTIDAIGTMIELKLSYS